MKKAKPCFSGFTEQIVKNLNASKEVDSKNIMLKSMQKPECYWLKTEDDIEIDSLIGYPQIDEIYKPIENECYTGRESKHQNNSNFDIWFSLVISLILISLIIIIYIKFRGKPKLITRSNRLI